jgi:hypothetical protein
MKRAAHANTMMFIQPIANRSIGYSVGYQSRCLLGLALSSNGGLRSLDLLFVGKEVMLDGLELLIELVHDRNAGWNVQLDNVRVRHVVEVLDQCAQAVAMCRDQHSLLVLQLRNNHLYNA